MNSNQFLTWLDARSSSLESQDAGPRCPSPKTLIMGILNVTPDSFSDGGDFFSTEKACEHAFHMIEQGADLIDIGGESTKPGAEPVPVEIELARVIPVIESIRKDSDICISIDTHKPEVMREAVSAGATLINDINGLRSAGALSMAAKLKVPVCLMHMQGNPQIMQENPYYASGVVEEVKAFFEERMLACLNAGIPKNKLILDPGFGYGKQVRDNLQLVNHLESFKSFKLPVLMGMSRKSTIGAILNKPVSQRLIGSIVIGVYAVLKGVDILRTHDVDETNQALKMLETIEEV